MAHGRLEHRVDRIANEVEYDLLDLDLVGEHQIDLRIEVEPHAHTMFLGTDQRQRARFLDQLGQAFDAPFGLSARDEIPQAADNLARPQCLVGGAIDRLGDSLVGDDFPIEQHLAALEIIGDRRQRLVEFMGQRRGHFAERS